MSDNVVLDGQPYGVVAILWHNRLNRLVTPYKHFSTRCCAVKVDFSHFTCVLICVSFPSDNFSNYATDELSNVSDELDIFIHTLDADCIIIGGDLHTDFSRCNAQSNLVSAFCERVNIKPDSSFLEAPFLFTRSCGNAVSFIDHFLVSSAYASSVACVDWRLFDDSVVNEVNLSDHCAVSLTVVPPSVDVNTAQDKAVHASSVPKPSTLLQQACAEHIEQFKLFVSAKIIAIVCDVPAHLFAFKGCSAQAHLDALDSLALKLHAVLADGTVACIPHHNSNVSVKPKVLIGWNNEYAQLMADSLFWYRLWVSGGRPNIWVVHNIMRSTRKRYYFADKCLLRSQTDLRNASLAETSINKPPNVFWREVKRANARSSSAQVSMDKPIVMI